MTLCEIYEKSDQSILGLHILDVTLSLVELDGLASGPCGFLFYQSLLGCFERVFQRAVFDN